MPAETDLQRMLASLDADVRPGEYVYVTLPEPDAGVALQAHAAIREREGVSYVLKREDAETRELMYDFPARWLTLNVHSALEAVGLTAAVASALASVGVPCNVLAGFYRDHLLVPPDRVDDALAAIASLRRRPPP